MKRELPSRDYVASLLEYDSETGRLTWKKHTPPVRAGQVAGSMQKNGYVSVSIGQRRYLAHRIAWLLSFGSWPTGVVDHINGITTDNRISNLRACTQGENQRNRGAQRNNKSGVKGISWDKRRSLWQGWVERDGRRTWVGYHKNLDDAERAIIEIRSRLHGEFANHGDRKSDASAE